MDLGLQGRVAAIMGASAGIGKAIAVGLAAEGTNLVLMSRDRANLDPVAAEITERHPVEVLVHPADTTDAASIDAAATAAGERFGTVNILVNSPGLRMRRFDRQILWEDEDWAHEVNVKAIGMLRTIRAFLPILATDGTGRIVNIGGMSGRIVWESALTHGLNNAAMEQMSRYLARDLAAAKINVTTVAPGLVGVEWRQDWATAMAEKSSQTVDEFLESYCASKGVLAGRWGTSEEVADVAVFLASDRAQYVNGTTLVVDGGASINPR